MTDRIEAAIKNYRNHCNCSQSILCAWADKLNMNETSIYRLSEGFGAGMGMHETCGAIIAILAILSYHCSDGDLGNGKTKAQTYRLMQETAERFKNKYSSITCRELLELRKKQEAQTGVKTCEAVIRSASTLLEEILKEKNLL